LWIAPPNTVSGHVALNQKAFTVALGGDNGAVAGADKGVDEHKETALGQA
jgi:hypothetical protein